MICKSCLSQHKKLDGLRDHLIKPFKKFKQSANESTIENENESTIENENESIDFPEKQNTFSKCLRHMVMRD